MRILFAGTPDVAVPSLAAVAASDHEIVGVITRADAPVGRKRTVTPSPVAVAAEALGLPVLKTNTLDDDATVWASERHPDLGVVVAYGGLIRQPLLTSPALGWVNLHFSSLPRWRGAAPVQRALMAGEQTIGVSVFRLVEALDSGEILARDSVDLSLGTSAGTALELLAEFGTGALLEAIERLGVSPEAGEPQHEEPSYAHKLTRTDGKLDLTRSTRSVLAHWAGVTPEPGAYVETDGATLKILEIAPLDVDMDPAFDRTEFRVGEARLMNKRALLSTQDGLLELVRVQPSGKAPMDAAAWLRGRSGKAMLI